MNNQKFKQFFYNESNSNHDMMCAWCRKRLETNGKTTGDTFSSEDPIYQKASHGICSKCAEKHFPVNENVPIMSTFVKQPIGQPRVNNLSLDKSKKRKKKKIIRKVKEEA